MQGFPTGELKVTRVRRRMDLRNVNLPEPERKMQDAEHKDTQNHTHFHIKGKENYVCRHNT